MKLLITDLDNTLYDWVTYFARSFRAMLVMLEELTDINLEQLKAEFKQVHQRHHNTEHPYASLELPSIQARFGTKDRALLHSKLEPAFRAFRKTRQRTLKLYPGVREALETMHAEGLVLVAHTEASLWNSYYRLCMLDIEKHFAKVFSIQGTDQAHPVKGRDRSVRIDWDRVELVPPEERKPNVRLLQDICERLGVAPGDAVYVGDSLTRDMMMAVEAGVFAAWARYGRDYAPEDWQLLVEVTHWTEEDVLREESLRARARNVEPDVVLNRYDDLLDLVRPDNASIAIAVG